jgi:hypothetical protein
MPLGSKAPKKLLTWFPFGRSRFVADGWPSLLTVTKQRLFLSATKAASSGLISVSQPPRPGYSGWDDCLLEALNQSNSFANNLYWLARGEESVSERVREFLRSHANAFWVGIEDGGKFTADLHARLCPGAPKTELLHNPVRPLREQLEAIRLFDIATGTATPAAPPTRAGSHGRFWRRRTDIENQPLNWREEAPV